MSTENSSPCACGATTSGACASGTGAAGASSENSGKTNIRSGAIQNGKGDAPRNIGPRFRMNYDKIEWSKPSK